MNKAYRIVWNAARQAWVVASEHAGSGGRPPLSVRNVTGALLLLGVTGASTAATYNNTVVSGYHVSQTLYSGDTANGVTVTDTADQNISSGASATSTTVTAAGSQSVFSGGSATSTVVSGKKSHQYVNDGGFASGTIVSNSAGQLINFGGSAASTTLNSGGTLQMGGILSGLTTNSGGRAEISGILISANISSGGVLNINDGGIAGGIVVHSGGALTASTRASVTGNNALGAFFISGGLASNVLVENGGTLYISAGNKATGTTVRSGGTSYVALGTAISSLVSADGVQSVQSGAVALDTQINSGGSMMLASGGYATSTTVNGGTLRVWGATSGTTLNSGSILIVSSGGSDTSATINAGTQNVYDGGTVVSASVNSAGTQYIYSGGSASNILVNAGGAQYVNANGFASGTVVSAFGAQYVNDGTATSTTLLGGLQDVSSLGSTTGTVINSGGVQQVSGSDISSTVNADGEQDIFSGGSALNTSIFSDGRQYVYGTALSATVNSGGLQYVEAGGLATASLLNSGGSQVVSRGGSAVSAAITGGTQDVYGEADATTVSRGGAQYVNSGGSATHTSVLAGAAQGVAGNALSTIINASGNQYVYSGGTVSWTTVTNNGFMTISSGGSAIGATISSGGTLYVHDGAIASGINLVSDAVLRTSTGASLTGTNALGVFSISGGHAHNVLLENNGFLNVEPEGLSTGTVVRAGGWESVSGNAAGTTVNAGGLQSVSMGGVATDTLVNSGGEQDVSGTAIRTTVKNGGLLAVLNGGNATDTSVAAGGVLNIVDGGILALSGGGFVNNGITIYDTSTSAALNTNLTGGGQFTKTGSGLLSLGGTLNQPQINLKAGTLVMDGLQAVTSIIAQSGTTLSLVNSAILTGTIDPTDVKIDGSSTWNVTGDSLLNNLTNAGNIVFVPSKGAFTPHIITVTNLKGNSGTITLNTVAGDSSSPIDKVVINGGKVTGNTGLQVLNRGGLGAQTTGSGITVIQAINGATTDVGAFNLNKPLVAGAYSYSLYRNANQSWYLTSQKISSGIIPDPDNIVTKPVNYRDGMLSYAAIPSLSLDYDRLVAGSTDSRFHFAPDSRIWGGLTAGHLSHPDNGSFVHDSVPESSGAYSFFKLGSDIWQFQGVNAEWRAGVYGATGLMSSDIWRDGSISTAGTDRDTVYTGGAYLSGYTNSGLRIHSLLQVSRHNLKAASNDGTSLSTTGTGWLASADVSQSFIVHSALALEPQLQYTLQGLSLDDSQDDAAKLSWNDSRRQSVTAGLKVGTPQDSKTKVLWWVTPSITQSYSGHSRVTASVPDVADSEASFRSNLSGTKVGLNGGVSARVRQNVTLGLEGGWSESLHGGEAGGYYGLANLGVSFR